MPCKVATYSFILSSQTDIENEFALGVYTCVECFYSPGPFYHGFQFSFNYEHTLKSNTSFQFLKYKILREKNLQNTLYCIYCTAVNMIILYKI